MAGGLALTDGSDGLDSKGLARQLPNQTAAREGGHQTGEGLPPAAHPIVRKKCGAWEAMKFHQADQELWHWL